MSEICSKCGKEFDDLSQYQGKQYCQVCYRKQIDEEAIADNKTKPNDELKEIRELKNSYGMNNIAIILGIILIGAIFISLYLEHMKKAEITAANEAKEKLYNDSIQKIQEKNWDEAVNSLLSLRDNRYKDYETLYNYSVSNKELKANNIKLAVDYAKYISESYTGVLSEEIVKYRHEIDNKNCDYVLALIKNKQYYDAAVYSVNDNLLKPFYNIAQGFESINKGDLGLARLFAENTKNYNGYAANEINSLRNQILNVASQEKIAAEEAAEKARKKSEGVRIGMTQQEVLDSNWGRPKDINRTTGSYGVHEQWVYSGYNYLYFENGILTTIQN